MRQISLSVQAITKEFNRRSIFKDVTFALNGGDSIAITGRNGSGKSTLVKIVSGLLSPTRGTVEYQRDNKPVQAESLRGLLGLVSPYLQLYDEFTGFENLNILSTIRTDTGVSKEDIEARLQQVGLWERRKDFVRTYSSGMKQRLKYAFALLHQPAVLILDEPTSNLDHDGIDMVRKVVELQRSQGLLIVATNDENEAAWCTNQMMLGKRVS